MMMSTVLNDPTPIGPRLTEKQIEIRDLVARGLTAKEIAVRLGISHRTVEWHREEIYKRMGVGNAIEMIRKMLDADRP